MLPAAALSAFLNNTPVVAIFIPAVQDWAKRIAAPVRLLIPLSYASIAGGTCTLIGTSTNLVVDGMYTERGGGTGWVCSSWPGSACRWWPRCCCSPAALPVIAGCCRRAGPAAESFAGRAPLHHRDAGAADSPLAGKSIEAAGLRQLPGLFLVEIERDGQIMPAVSSQEVLRDGRSAGVRRRHRLGVDLQRIRGLVPATDQVFKLGGPRQDRCFVEAVLSNKCPLIGRGARGSFSRPLQRRDHRAVAQRRAGGAQDRRHRARPRRYPAAGDAPGVRAATAQLQGLPGGQPARRHHPHRP
jgi:hypothetical protein